MSMPALFKGRLSIPVIGSPLFIISVPDLVIAQCKAGVVGLSETLCAELSACNVGVTVLCPAGFASNLAENAARAGRAIDKSTIGRTVKADMDKGKHTSETVALFAIKEMENGNLYSIPQIEYRAFWAFKRLMPNTFYKTIGWLYRNKLGPFSS